MSVWFVSPAYGRYDVSDIVWEQRAWMLERLRAHKVDAHALVMADDENISLAQAHGLETLRHRNLPLGAKLNAGIQHAYKRGAEQVCFIGSDSLALPGCFRRLPPDAVTYGCWYTVVAVEEYRQRISRGRAWVEGGGLRVAVLHVPVPTWALNVYPRALLKRSGGKPVGEGLNRGLDGSIRTRLGEYEEREVEVGPYQVVSLRTGVQITSTHTLIDRYHDRDGSFEEMAAAGYPEATVDRIRELYRTPERRRR